MLERIRGIHHISAMARDGVANNAYFTRTLGLRRVKTTVNFDEPSVHHLYYGDRNGTPGSVMTYFPFPHIIAGRPGTGEVGETAFAVPEGSLSFWTRHLSKAGVAGIVADTRFGEKRLRFRGVDGDHFALVETGDPRPFARAAAYIPLDAAIGGFWGATLRLRASGPTEELLNLMGYAHADTAGGIRRYVLANANGAGIIDIETLPNMERGTLGAGSVHHIAFSVPTEADQHAARAALADAGYQVTPVLDRSYFRSIYFRTPGGVLFEIATETPGFTVDEDIDHLGAALKLPAQHEHLREKLETLLPAIKDQDP